MNTYTTYSDEQLLQLLKDSDEAAFCEIYQRYNERLSLNAIKLTGSYDEANDIVQEIFIALWNNRLKITITASLGAYLDTSVRFGSFRVLQNIKRKNGLLASIAQFMDKNSTGTSSPIEIKELQQKVEGIISDMPSRMKAVYIMSREEQMTHKEIGAILDISEETSRKQVKNALRIIRHQLNILSSLF